MAVSFWNTYHHGVMIQGSLLSLPMALPFLGTMVVMETTFSIYGRRYFLGHIAQQSKQALLFCSCDDKATTQPHVLHSSWEFSIKTQVFSCRSLYLLGIQHSSKDQAENHNKDGSLSTGKAIDRSTSWQEIGSQLPWSIYLCTQRASPQGSSPVSLCPWITHSI
ncbi:predicted protein [Lichtheimia corymbifera JMRC:FSU:9682]|uniref:Uncharacterized protein n=1 Tax=Lichtheimia corymbifera JMRC:FSU:9682 TaxID=1263082 RepID=A0A068SGW7_9FUNG|nr:predicted protein [Lichtheimia corymbifera JMRC:FSU:9682]CDH61433.1 predicted protein [Lichtheimia corymbifera JMRC:FSU:9682]